MKSWPTYPVIYEINTWVWLQELSERYQCPVSLATVPGETWDAIAELAVDAVWLMGQSLGRGCPGAGAAALG